MSNFICSECGMTNIDCGYDGYKTPKEIELEKKVHILNKANMTLENELGRFAEASKTIERLQEQLNECEEALVESYYDCYNEGFEPDLAKEYLKKYNIS